MLFRIDASVLLLRHCSSSRLRREHSRPNEIGGVQWTVESAKRCELDTHRGRTELDTELAHKKSRNLL